MSTTLYRRRRHLKIPRSQGGGEQYSGPTDASTILDGMLLARLPAAGKAVQDQVAAAAGSTVDQLIADLAGLAIATTF